MKKICIIGAVIMFLITIGYLLNKDIKGANISIIGLLSVLNTYAILEKRNK